MILKHVQVYAIDNFISKSLERLQSLMLVEVPWRMNDRDLRRRAVKIDPACRREASRPCRFFLLHLFATVFSCCCLCVPKPLYYFISLDLESQVLVCRVLLTQSIRTQQQTELYRGQSRSRQTELNENERETSCKRKPKVLVMRNTE